MRCSVFALVGSGCLYIGPVQRPPTLWDCPDTAYCWANVKIDVSDLVACYGTSAGLPTDLIECAGAMDHNDQYCNISWEDETFEAVIVPDTTECCEYGADTGANCCEEATWELTSTGETNLKNLIQQDCALTWHYRDDVKAIACDLDGSDVVDDGTCDEKDIDPTGFSGAEYALWIDPELSYVDVDLGSETVSSGLEGWARLASAPKRVLFAVAWGEDFTVDGDQCTDNSVVLSTEVQLSGSSNTFSVPVSQDFDIRVQGLREGEGYRFNIAPQVSSGGTFNPGGGVWSYDYYEAGSGTSTTVHLEGDLTAVSP
jgi:hypothetical protein